MFGLFKRQSEREKLEKQYRKLLEDAYKLSHTDRTAADRMQAKAEELAKRIEKLPR